MGGSLDLRAAGDRDNVARAAGSGDGIGASGVDLVRLGIRREGRRSVAGERLGEAPVAAGDFENPPASEIGEQASRSA